MTTTTYNFSVTDRSADHFLSADPDSAKGTLEDAIELAKTFECKVSLTDAAGFLRGWVYASGSYTLK